MRFLKNKISIIYVIVILLIILSTAVYLFNKKEMKNITELNTKTKTFIQKENTDIKEVSENIQKDNSQEFVEKVSGESEAKRLGQVFPWSDFTPTGFYVLPNADLEIIITQISGANTPTLLIGTYSRYQKNENPQEVKLKIGNNKIKSNKYGGLVYVRFNTSNNPNSKVSLEFINGFEKSPTYILGKSTKEDWQKQLKEYKDAPDVMMISNRTMMVFSMAHALKWQEENQDYVLKSADKIMAIEDKISGLDGGNERDRPNIHKILITETNIKQGWGFANYYRTYFVKEAAVGAFTSKIISDGWGAWHELGHMHQQDAWTWTALDEVTVNIYSLAVERALGISPNRLERDKVYDDVEKYLGLSDDERDFNDDEQASVWVRLAMFEELRQKFGDEFFIKLHKETRKEKPQLNSDEEKIIYFKNKANKISGQNLDLFFKKWGL